MLNVELNQRMERKVVAVWVPGEAVGVVAGVVLGVAERVGAGGFQEIVGQRDGVRVAHARQGDGGEVFAGLVLAHVATVVGRRRLRVLGERLPVVGRLADLVLVHVLVVVHAHPHDHVAALHVAALELDERVVEVHDGLVDAAGAVVLELDYGRGW